MCAAFDHFLDDFAWLAGLAIRRLLTMQANSDLKTELDAAKAARRLAEWESSEVNKMNTAR